MVRAPSIKSLMTELRLSREQEITECHGVEYVRLKDASFNDEPLATYCNAGDTYAATLVYYRG